MCAIDLVIEAFAVLVGVPWQRRRARRLARAGRGQVVLAYPNPSSALATSRMTGVATFAPGSLQLGDWRTHVLSVAVPGRVGRDVERQDSRMVFGAKDQVVVRVESQRGGFDLTLVGVVAGDLVARLRVTSPGQAT